MIRRWAPYCVLGLATLAFAIGFAWLSVLRHQAFQSHAFDLGNMDQAVWNTLQGRPLRFTDMALPDGSVLTNRLAIHVEPLLLLLAPFYLLHSGPATLLVIQALVVATGAIPAYLLARGQMLGPWMSLVFPLAYLLHPSLQNAVLDDFHAVTLSAAFLLWALYFLWRDALPPFVVFAVLAAATKEEIALLVALLGLALMLRRRPAGAAVFVGSVVWFLVAVLVIIPHFNPGGHSPYLARYAYLGHGLGGMVLGALTHPTLVWQTLISLPRLLYLDALLDPLAFTSLLGLPVLLLALPSFAVNMLSDDATMYSGFYQYSAEIVPYLITASVVGVAAAGRLGRAAKVAAAPELTLLLAALVLAASLAATWQYGFSPLAQGYTIPSVGPHQRLETRLLGAIPPKAVVAAADEIEPHLSDRRTIYLLPTVDPSNAPPAQYIALDASIPSQPVTPWLLHHTAWQAIGRGYGIQAARDGVLVLERGVARRTLPPSFFTFVYGGSPRKVVRGLHWGPLSLVGVTVHPSYRWVNRARPAVEVETYWRTARPLSRRVSLAFAVSPVYQRHLISAAYHPAPTGASVPRWSFSTDSPTLDWLPINRWPPNRTIKVASLPVTLAGTSTGKVAVGIEVTGLGPARGVPLHRRVAGDPRMVRLTTVSVRL